MRFICWTNNEGPAFVEAESVRAAALSYAGERSVRIVNVVDLVARLTSRTRKVYWHQIEIPSAIEPRASDPGPGPLQRKILELLRARGELHAAAIARELGVTRQNVDNGVHRLKKRGLIKAAPPCPRRRIMLSSM